MNGALCKGGASRSVVSPMDLSCLSPASAPLPFARVGPKTDRNDPLSMIAIRNYCMIILIFLTIPSTDLCKSLALGQSEPKSADLKIAISVR